MLFKWICTLFALTKVKSKIALIAKSSHGLYITRSSHVLHEVIFTCSPCGFPIKVHRLAGLQSSDVRCLHMNLRTERGLSTELFLCPNSHQCPPYNFM